MGTTRATRETATLLLHMINYFRVQRARPMVAHGERHKFLLGSVTSHRHTTRCRSCEGSLTGVLLSIREAIESIIDRLMMAK